MSIVRVGLAETKNFSEGYDAIFGKKDEQTKQPDATAPAAPTQAEPAKKDAPPEEKK